MIACLLAITSDRTALTICGIGSIFNQCRAVMPCCFALSRSAVFQQLLPCLIMFFTLLWHLLGSHQAQLGTGDDGEGFWLQSEVKLRHLIHSNGRRDTSNNDHKRRSGSHQPSVGTSCGLARRAAEGIAASSESSLADGRGTSNGVFSA